MNYWLLKIEPSLQSIDDLAAMPGQRVGWYGVRNYQARNFMRDSMRDGDIAFYYHSSCPEPGIVGLVRVDGPSYPDPTQFDPSSPYFDPGAKPESPRWFQVDVTFVRKSRLLDLASLRQVPGLAGMRLLQKGNRLSVSPVTLAEAEIILGLLA